MVDKTDKRLFQKAKKYIPGGVNSPVRSFKSVGGYPVFVKKASGSKLYSSSGKAFIDHCLSWGALILGHAKPKVIKSLSEALRSGTSFGAATSLETELAKLITEALPSVDQVRMTSSGTEAVMGAIRLARAYTGKNMVIKFEGAYHGHADYLLVKAGSGAATLGRPDSLGVPKAFTKQTAIVPFNDIEGVEKTVKRYGKDLAAIIVEPVLANCGLILPKQGFLKDLRKIADKNKIVLIFDEVITGFRLSYSGAQGYFNVKPDLTCLGKIIGGGLPVGAFGGKRKIMKFLAPLGGAYQAGTLSGNPIAVTAGTTTLNILKKKAAYKVLAGKTEYICESIRSMAKRYGISCRVNHIGSIFNVYFIDRDVTEHSIATEQDKELFKKFYQSMLKQGVYFSPSPFEVNFLSTAHTAKDIDHTLSAIKSTFRKIGTVPTF